jgi:phosphoribosylformylglycinamidine cyclo-ligase
MSFAEAARVWNMGIGYVVVVPADAVASVSAALTSAGETVYTIGEVATGVEGVEFR